MLHLFWVEKCSKTNQEEILTGKDDFAWCFPIKGGERTALIGEQHLGVASGEIDGAIETSTEKPPDNLGLFIFNVGEQEGDNVCATLTAATGLEDGAAEGV